MGAQTVAELQSESCPRISGADLLDLLDSSKFPRRKALVIDIRSPELYPSFHDLIAVKALFSLHHSKI